MSLLSWLWSGAGTNTPPNQVGTGFASGHATVTGISAALGVTSAIGLATGTATASAVGKATAASLGAATGTASIEGRSAAVSDNDGVLGGLRLEFALPSIAFAAAGFQADAFGGSGWASMIEDTLAADPIVLDYGVQGNAPDDRVGSTGTLSFTLNNSSTNQAGIASYYSPLHANHRAGAALNVPVRLILEVAGQTYHKFLGRLAETSPEPGRHGRYRVPCVAVDLMDDWAANEMPVVMPVIQGWGASLDLDLLFTTLGTLAPDQAPATRSLETSIDVLPYSFHNPTRRKIRELIIDAVMSEFGFASFRGGTDTAGNFCFFNRHAPSTYPVDLSLINQFSVDDGFQTTQSRDALASSIEVFVHPVAVDETDVDIFKLEGAALLILPFQTTIVHLPFRTIEHPDAPIAALSLQTPVPFIDYTANTMQDGSGTDITDHFEVLYVNPSGGFEAVVSIRNRGPEYVALDLESGLRFQPIYVPPGFLTLLKGRGRGLYISEASARVDLDTTYGRRPLQIVMPWQANVNTATDIAHFFGQLHRNPFAQVDAVKFCANKTQTLMTAAVFTEPGALVYIQEDVTGIAGTFRVQGVRLEIQSGVVWCTWRLQNVDRQKFWLLGTIDRSELGLTTILGY